MKVLFVNVVNEQRKRRMEHHVSSLGTGYLASYLRDYGGYRDVEIVEAGQSFNAAQYDADIVGISSVTQNFNIAKKVAENVKANSNALVMVGGHHITALPSNLTRDMDVAVLGEGEQTALQVVRAYEHGQNFSKIKGVAYKQNGTLRTNPRRELIKPLDKIPFPARNLMRVGLRGTIPMYTSRGCPYRCVFCSSAFFWSSIRFFSTEYVVSEIAEIVETYNPKRINLSDDLFIADKNRVKKIAEKVRKKGLHRMVEFHCNARANLVTDEIAKLLKAMNVQTVSMGLESGSPRMLKYLKGDTVTVKQNEHAINVLKKHGLNVNASFIIGSPTETREDVMETYRFIEHSNLDGGATFVMLPLPGTAVWDYGVGVGVLGDFMDWSRFEIYFEDDLERMIISDLLSREELVELYGLFQRLWRKHRRGYLLKQAFKHPRRILPYAVRALRERTRDESF